MRMVVLNESLSDADFRERPFVVALQKESAVIFKHPGFQYEGACNIGGSDFHSKNTFRTHALSAFAADKLRSGYSSSRPQPSPPARPEYIHSETRSLPRTPP